MSQMLSVKAAAARSGLSPSLLYQLCREKRLRHYRVGGRGRRGRLLLDEADLKAFLSDQLVTPVAPVEAGLKYIRT